MSFFSAIGFSIVRNYRRASPAALLTAAMLAFLSGCGGGSGSGSGVTPPVTTYAVGGTITGIAADNHVVLQNNGSDSLTVASDGTFVFKQGIASGASFDVTLSSVPSGQVCTTIFANGTVQSAPVTSVNVICGPAQQGAFHSAASISTARMNAIPIALPDGTVLAIGGINNVLGSVFSIERYNPVTDAWSAAGTVPGGTTAATTSVNGAVLLKNGKVLIGVYGASPQLYDPATQTFSAAGAYASLQAFSQTVTLLDGRVLATDGQNFDLYDPVAETWTAAAKANSVHVNGSFTLLNSGKVLAAGGGANPASIADSEIFDPASGKWSPVGSLATSRFGHIGVLLPSGKVLAVGGLTGVYAHYCSCGFGDVANAELFDPASNTWGPAGTLITNREDFTATLMPNGQVLVAGGNVQSQFSGSSFTLPTPMASAEVYNPATNSWAAWGSLLTARTSHAATLTRSGKLLVVGGIAYFPNNPPQNLAADYYGTPILGSEIGW